jgi:hypothetical protein
MQSIYLLVLTSALLLACGGRPDKGVPAPGGLKDVPRSRTLIMDCIEPNTCAGQIVDYDAFNPFVPGGISRRCRGTRVRLPVAGTHQNSCRLPCL